MVYRRYGRSRSIRQAQHRSSGSTFSGSQGIVRHSVRVSATIGTGKTQAFPLVAYNPTNRGTLVDIDGSSTKNALNVYTAEGSRVNYVTVQMTIKQSDTSKNNTVYTGTISTSFNDGQLSTALMTTNFNDFIASNSDGEMTTAAAEKTYNLTNYSINDIQQHNIRGLLNNQMQLYAGRVIQANQTIPLPRKNKRQQNGSIFALVIMNDSATGGSDIEVILDVFFKEIPVNTV